MACDPYWNDTVLACHFNGTNNSTTIVDEKGHTLTANGDAKLTTSSPKVGTACLTLDGSGDYVQVTPVSSELSFSGDFTIEFWCYCNDNTNNYPTIIGTQGGWSAGSFCYRFDNTGQAGKFSIHWNGATPADPFIASSSSYSFNQWRHTAFVRSGTTCTLYVDGVAVGTGTCGAALNLAYGGSMRIGWSAWDGAAGYFLGQIDDLRISNVARYLSNFTPSASEFVTNQCTLSGIVKDSSATPASRLVRAHRRDTGELVGAALSNGTTGLFNVPVRHSGECYVVRIDDTTDPPTTGTENALIYDRVLPA